MPHQNNLEIAILRTDTVREQAKVFETLVAENLGLIDYNCSAMTFRLICHRAFERLDQFQLAPFVGRHSQLRQHNAKNFLEAEPRIGYAGQVKVRDSARENRIQQRGLTGAGFAGQQHEPALIMQQAPFQRGQAFAMSGAEIQSCRGRREAKRRSIESEVLVIHGRYTRSLRTATIGSPVSSLTTPEE